MAEVLIRPMRPDDALDWYNLRTQPKVVWGTLQLPTISLEDVRSQAVAAANMHKLVAEVSGRMVGTVGLHVGAGAQRHVGYLGMSIHDEFQGKGIGRMLMNAALDLADNWLLLDRVELGVYPDNERAVHLYETSGFVAEGLSPAAVWRDGELIPMLHMGRLSARAAAAGESPVTTGPRNSLPPIEPHVRGVRPEEARAIHALYLQPGIAEALGRLPSTQEDELRKELCALPKGQHMLVAEHEGQVLGTVHLTQLGARRSHNATIKQLAVHPAWHGRGVGAALLQAATDLAEKWLGVTRLELAVPACAPAALALCRKFGFELEAVFRKAWIYRGTLADLHLMGRLSRR